MDNQLIGTSIASLRQKRGWTQRQLARQLGVSHQAVSKWEKGDAAPDVETLVALARLFGVTIDRLLTPKPEDLKSTPPIFNRHNDSDFDDLEEDDEEEDDEEDFDEEEDELADAEREWHHHDHHSHHRHTEVRDPKLKLLMQMAPFMSREVLDEKFTQYLQKNDLENYHILESLAPFVSRETLSVAIDKIIGGEIAPEFVVRLAPFIGRKDLVRLIKKSPDQEWVVNNLGRLAPFLPQEYIDEIVRGIDF